MQRTLMNLARTTLTTALLTTASLSQAAEGSITDEVMARFIGNWEMDLMAHPESFGDHGGPGSGAMNCQWGLQRAWVDCQMDSIYEGLGTYGLKIILYRLRNDGEVGAFVTNSFGGGRLYEGVFDGENRLVFHDAWVDPARAWQHQRTVYTFEPDGRIRFLIDVADDGVNYLPHSSGVYTRQRADDPQPANRDDAHVHRR